MKLQLKVKPFLPNMPSVNMLNAVNCSSISWRFERTG